LPRPNWNHGLVNGYRSGLEERVGQQLKAAGLPVQFESVKIRYEQPSRPRTYTPDFVLPNGIIIETKGRFTPQDRQKHLLIKDQNPGMDLRFVFTNPNAKINKGSRTTYAMWCDKYGFKYSRGLIPKEWLR
jgi:hypothetical protein